MSSFKRVHSLSSDKQKRRDCNSPIAHWAFFYHSFLFIEGWGTANVHRMWCTFNHWTYLTCLLGFYWNEREPLYSSISACVVAGYFAWEDFWLFESTQYLMIFWDHLWFYVSYSPFKYLFKNIHIPVSTCTYLKFKKKIYIYIRILSSYMMTKCVSPWYNRTGWLGVKHQITYLHTCYFPNVSSPFPANIELHSVTVSRPTNLPLC